MAGNSLGALTVSLGLDASEYTRGLTRAEIQAQQFSRNVRSTILEVGKVLGTLEIGRQVLESTKAIIGEASALNDLSDATGSSVESLSRLNNQAKIAGADFNTLQSAVLKLSAGMSGADEESTKAKEALRLLGITTKDPVEALQQVAVKLNGYADGVNKVGLAVALFGKQGGQFLSTLKDIAELQEVGATVTKKQAQEAEALEQAYRRLSVESEGFKNVILNSVVPALTNMISEMREGINIAGGFGAALRLFGTLNPFDTPREGIKKLAAEIDELEKQRPKIGRFGQGEIAELDSMIADRRKQIEFLKVQERNAIKIDPNDTNVRDQILLRKPAAPALPPDGKTGRALKEQTDEALRYLDALLKQQQATLDLTTEETALVAIFDIEARTRRKVSDEIKDQIIDSARQIDQAKEAKKAADDLRRSQEEEARIRARNSESATRAIENAQREAQSLRDGNETMKEQLVFLRGGQDALDAYTTSKLLTAAAEKEHAAAMIENVDASSLEAKALRESAAALKERAGLLADTKAAEAFIESQKRLQDDLNRLFDSAGSSLLDFVSGTKSAKDAFKDFARSIERDLSQMALAFLKNQLLNGGKGNAGSLFDVIGSFFGGGFSGGGGGSGFGGGGGLGYAAAGTSWSHGGAYMVGENGPEIVNLPSGARVTPKNYSTAGANASGGEVHVHQTIMPGADTRAHRQAALDAFKGAAGAARRR